jgi:hypothetical protein
MSQHSLFFSKRSSLPDSISWTHPMGPLALLSFCNWGVVGESPHLLNPTANVSKGKDVYRVAFICHRCCCLYLKVLSFQFYVLVYFFCWFSKLY